jgi:ATP-binding cassette subfamily B (MDR/TAP) protein 1
MDKWVYCLIGCAAAQLLFGFVSKHFFGTLGENVTLQIRKDLYNSILRKNIGWFDHQDHAPSVLTSVMAEDSSQINGVASETLATTLESTFAVLIGVGIGFYYCWQLSVVCICVLPAMAFGTILGAKFK